MPPTFNAHDRPNGWLLAFLILPWLSPFTAGPTPNVWPLLLSALCAVVLWFCRHRLNARLVAAGWLAAAAVSALIALVQQVMRGRFQLNPQWLYLPVIARQDWVAVLDK